MKLPFKPQLLKFPIGPFEPKERYQPEERSLYINQIKRLPDRLNEITTSMQKDHYLWCYRSGGWSIGEVIHHLADSHMNAFLRLKWALFEENPSIKGYDENLWSHSADVTSASIVSSLQLIEGLHDRWTTLLLSLTETDWKKGYFHPEKDAFVSLDEYLANYAWHCEHHYRHILLALDHEGQYKK